MIVFVLSTRLCGKAQAQSNAELLSDFYQAHRLPWDLVKMQILIQYVWVGFGLFLISYREHTLIRRILGRRRVYLQKKEVELERHGTKSKKYMDLIFFFSCSCFGFFLSFLQGFLLLPFPTPDPCIPTRPRDSDSVAVGWGPSISV